MVISVNLLGLWVRGLFKNESIKELELTGSDFVKSEIKKDNKFNIYENILFIILNILFLLYLIEYWNIGVMFVSIIIMLSRLPDLLWEIKNKRRLQISDTKLLPKGTIYYITGFSWLIEIPLLYYSLFYL